MVTVAGSSQSGSHGSRSIKWTLLPDFNDSNKFSNGCGRRGSLRNAQSSRRRVVSGRRLTSAPHCCSDQRAAGIPFRKCWNYIIQIRASALSVPPKWKCSSWMAEFWKCSRAMEQTHLIWNKFSAILLQLSEWWGLVVWKWLLHWKPLSSDESLIGKLRIKLNLNQNLKI